MEKRSSSFTDHLNIVETAHSKTASKRTGRSEGSLLSKIAEELGLAEGVETQAAPAAAVTDGVLIPAVSTVAEAAPAVVGATEAIIMPRIVAVGGNPMESAQGEIPAETKPNQGLLISAGDGEVTDAANFGKTPEAVAAYDGLSAEKVTEAEKIGSLIAKSFQAALEKQAEDAQYSEALEILKEAGLLDGYKINQQPMTKQASIQEGCLEKVANLQPVSRSEIIGAAVEFVELQKEAALAEEKGRSDAQRLVSNLVKQAEETAAETEEEEEEEEEEEMEEEKKTEEEKVASYLRDPSVVRSIKVLKSKGII